MGCARRPLAGSAQCVVEECGCGTIHVTIGSLTLRLCPSTVADISSTLAEAMQRWALAQLGGRGRAVCSPGEGASS
jgi:hypothetical protein